MTFFCSRPGLFMIFALVQARVVHNDLFFWIQARAVHDLCFGPGHKSHLKGGPGSSSPIKRAAICMHRRGAFVTVAKLEKKGVWQNNFFFKIAASCSNTTPVHKKGGPKGCRAQHGTPCWGRLW